jgi:ribonucleoside-triphosphate reductase
MMNVKIIKKDGHLQDWDDQKIIKAVAKSAFRVGYTFSDAENGEIVGYVKERIEKSDKTEIPVDTLHTYVEMALSRVNPDVAQSYKDYRNWKQEYARDFNELYKKANSVRFRGDRENANKDSSLVSVQQAIIRGELGRTMYKRTFLTSAEVEATNDGYIYIHDTDFRLDCINCCLFNIKEVLDGGFEMANMHYNEPKSLRKAFSVIGDVVLSAAPQQYGGFTLPEVDKVLSKYAERSYNRYFDEFKGYGMDDERADQIAWKKTVEEAEDGFQGWEYKFNTVGSSRGDYPFITTTFGLATDRFGKMLSKACLKVRAGGQGKKGHKKPVLFPKLVFLYDENIHGEGKGCEDVFEAGIECSQKAMYPDWLSMSGEGYISKTYQQYGKVISPMGCRAFLSPYWERGGLYKADEADTPVYEGRFNVGAVSLNLPMILAKSRQEGKDFGEVLNYYLEMIRNLHKRTYDYLGEMKASTNPLGFCEGGFYGGHLKLDDKIAPVLQSATASFGITALNELQELYNGKSIAEDGQFALEVMKYINAKIAEYKETDGHLYAIYGTPAESLTGKQVQQFRKIYGIVPKVSDRSYVSNSFHCHVSEKITPTEKQDKEYRFWELFNGGKIQYVRYPIEYNRNAVKSLVRRAMAMGLYEGVNLSLAYCEDCGHQELNMDVCPCCGSRNLTKIDRMNGYLSYSRVNGKTRLNDAKMDEIADRVSM